MKEIDTWKRNEIQIAELSLIRQRLREEGELDLLAKIAICQEPILLKCMSCGHKREVPQRCKRRWCPCCSKRTAADRATEMEYIVARMRYPLFVTLTMQHGSTVSSGDVTTLLSAFGKLRHRNIWKKRVGGGVATVELTNQGGGWHPHLHAVVDCYWLSITTRPPPKHFTLEQKKEVYKAASAEIGGIWAKILKQPTASCRVKRADHHTIAKEVTKYTVKAADLITSPVPIGEIIRSLDKRRALRTFGKAHGQKVAGIRQESQRYAKQKREEWQQANPREECCPIPDYTLAEFAENDRYVSKVQAQRRCSDPAQTNRHHTELKPKNRRTETRVKVTQK